MSIENLERHIEDGEWLKHVAQNEFAKAVRTGRLIAFTGSYATEGLGYPKWHDFLLNSLNRKSVVAEFDSWIDVAKSKIASGDPNSPAYFGIFEEAKGSNEIIRKYIQEQFQLKNPKLNYDQNNVPQQISDSLAINRIITLNYDLEFEWHFLTTSLEKTSNRTRATFFRGLLDPKKAIIQYDKSCKTSWHRHLPDGRSAVSDVFDRGRTDRLIEFGIGSADHEAHIMHLHGRVSDPETMIVSLRDYQEQYRRSSITKLPFEHAQRMLFAGNPVIFIGIGMSEDYINSVLEQFVSDRSDRYAAPAFVIWSAKYDPAKPETLADAELKRLFWYHRYRVMTLFDHELPEFNDKAWANKKGTSRVRYSIELLGKFAGNKVQPLRWRRDQFRTAQDRLKKWHSETNFDVWRRASNPDTFGENIFDGMMSATATGHVAKDQAAFNALFRGAPIKAIINEPGAGHGWMSKSIQTAFEEAAMRTGLHATASIKIVTSIVNASFVCEIDSTFAMISGLYDGQTAFDGRRNRRQALGDMMSDLEARISTGQNITRHILLIINGMDRFLDAAGRPLSNELDNMFRLAVKFHIKNPNIQKWVKGMDCYSPFTIVAMGTPRVRRYLEAIGQQKIIGAQSPFDVNLERQFTVLNEEKFNLDGKLQTLIDCMITRANGSTAPAPDVLEPQKSTSRYLQTLSKKMNIPSYGNATDAQSEAARFRRKGEWRHNFLSGCVRSSAFQAALKVDGKDEQLADLCLEIISALALFGQPVEIDVLIVVPDVNKWLGGSPDPLNAALDFLCEKQLVLKFLPFDDPAHERFRFGLHRAVMAEMRDRFGIPISDARLSCGFNLSLYASQPTDDYTPELDMQRKLGGLVDCLIAKDSEPLSNALEALAKATPSDATTIRGATFGRAATLRAALAIFRSYLSTSTILMQKPESRDNDRLVEDRKLYFAPLSQHASRLEMLIQAAEIAASDREAFRNKYNPYVDQMGPEPFFPDDLVWLHNELGVVRLAQGDLYEARHALNQAEMINRGHVEFDGRLQNWRRIQLNQLHIDIERGKISSAEARIRDIEHEVQNHAVDFGEIGENEDATEYVASQYGREIKAKIEAIDPIVPFDVVLSTGLVIGYRGFVNLLAGKIESGQASLEVACKIFSNIGEQRAYAIFQRIKSSSTEGYGNNDVAIAEAELSIIASEAVHHLDIMHLTHISMSRYFLDDNSNKQTAKLQKQLRVSLEYGHNGDAYRVRMEARHSLARLRFMDGDFDGALEHAADAMAMATRFGFSLRKITLRILIGEILIKRGDKISGTALVEQALKNADRIGYQRAVGRAQSVLIDDVT